MISEQQRQKIWQISDTTLYKEAPEFLRWLIQEKDCQPLPNTQINGLLNIAKGANYSELDQFIKHQRGRTWTFSKAYIQTFYTQLEIVFTTMRNKRLREEFHLLDSSLSIPQMQQQQANELMAALAYEFIQHLEAENRLLDALRADQRNQNRPQHTQKR